MVTRASKARGAALGAFRRLFDLTEQQLGQLVGVSEKRISHFESGQRELSIEDYLAFGRKLGLSVVRLEAAWFGLELREGEVGPGEGGGPGGGEGAQPPSLADEAERARTEEALRRRRASELAALVVTHEADRLFHEARRAEVARRERRKAEALCRRLLRLPAERQELWMAEDPAFQAWPVIEWLAEMSETLASSNPRRAKELAAWTLRAAQASPEAPDKPRKVGYAGFFFGNALRVCTDLEGAHGAFEESWSQWRAGEGPSAPPFAAWRPHDLEASLRRDQQLWSLAIACVDEALDLGPRVGAIRARILIKKATCFQLSRAYPRALPVLTEAAEHIAPEREPRLAFAIHFIFADCLSEIDRLEEAECHARVGRTLAAEADSPLDLARFDWLEARLLAKRGEGGAALGAFSRARETFAARNMALDCAAVALQESAILLEAGEIGRAKRIAIAVAWTFADQGIAREGREAIEAYCRAAEREQATANLARWASSRLAPGQPLHGPSGAAL